MIICSCAILFLYFVNAKAIDEGDITLFNSCAVVRNYLVFTSRHIEKSLLFTVSEDRS